MSSAEESLGRLIDPLRANQRRNEAALGALQPRGDFRYL